MSITNELRDYIKEQQWCAKGMLTAIADRIDAAHEEAIQREHEKAYDMGYAEGMGMANAKDAQAEYLRGKNDGYDEGWDAGLSTADELLAEHEDAMVEHGWYRVLDADKAPIKFNDDVEWELLGSGETERGRVVGIKIDLIADRQSCRVKVVRDSDFQTIELMAKNLRHVKPAEPEPTVEDVMVEFATDWESAHDGEDKTAVLKEYAAKLRLAGDAE